MFFACLHTTALAKKRAGFGTRLCQPRTKLYLLFQISFYPVSSHVFLADVGSWLFSFSY
tara:strand:+ start:2847 stop:3023 length:177 start_codon:yes stop_codon:yes gene_type:complete